MPSRQDVEAAIRRSAGDLTLTDNEKRELSKLLAAVAPDAATVTALRKFAVRTAAETAAQNLAARKLVDWLDGVTDVLLAAAPAAGRPAAPAAASPLGGGGLDLFDEHSLARNAPPPSPARAPSAPAPAAAAAPAPTAGAGTLEAYFSPGEECLRKIIALFNAAKRSVDVCVFTITDDRIADAIVSAHRRGVKIRIISDNDKANDPGSDIARFQQSGLAVKLDDTPAHMHHKFAIFDGAFVLSGSFNWTRGATRDNQENFIVASDARLLGAFAKEFEKLWARFR